MPTTLIPPTTEHSPHWILELLVGRPNVLTAEVNLYSESLS